MRVVRRFGPLLGVIVFTAALWIIHRELRQYHYHEIIGYLKEIPRSRLLLALALTFLNYIWLTGYDALALRYVKRPMPYRRGNEAHPAGLLRTASGGGGKVWEPVWQKFGDAFLSPEGRGGTL